MLKKALFALLALAIPHAAIAQTQLNLQTQVKNTLPVINGGTGTTSSTGTGAVVLATSPSLTTPLFSTSATITAGTNTQGQAPLTGDINVITTTAANPSGATLPTAAVGKIVRVINSGTNPVNLYPASGAAIDALGTNSPIQIQVGGSIEVQATSSTQWVSNLHIDVSNTTVIPTGTTTAQKTADLLASLKNPNIISASDPKYGSCVWDGSTSHDVGPCVNAAIAAATAEGGGNVVTPLGVYYFATNIVNHTSNVWLTGVGACVPRDSVITTEMQCGTTFIYNGSPETGPALLFSPTGTVRMYGVAIKGIGFECAQLVDTCEQITQANYSDYDLYERGARLTGVLINANNIDTSGAQHIRARISVDNHDPSYAATGVVIDSPDGYNASYLTIEDLVCVYGRGDCVVFGNEDTITVERHVEYLIGAYTTGSPFVCANGVYTPPSGVATHAVSGGPACRDNLFNLSGAPMVFQGSTEGSTIVAGGSNVGSAAYAPTTMSTTAASTFSTNALTFSSVPSNIQAGMTVTCGGVSSGVYPYVAVTSTTGTTVSIARAPVNGDNLTGIASGQSCTFGMGISPYAAAGTYTLTALTGTTWSITAPSGGHTQASVTINNGVLTGTDLVVPISGTPTAGDTFVVTTQYATSGNDVQKTDLTNSISPAFYGMGAQGWSTTVNGAVTYNGTGAKGMSLIVSDGTTPLPSGAAGDKSVFFAASGGANGPNQCVVGGSGNFAQSNAIFACALGGTNNTLTGVSGAELGSNNGNDNGLYGTVFHASGAFNSNGDAQWQMAEMRGSGSAATAFRLTQDGKTAGSANCINIPANTQMQVHLRVHAIDHTTPANGIAWGSMDGLLSRQSTLASTTLSFDTPPTPKTSGTTTGISISFAADTTNGCLNASFTPPSGSDVWEAFAHVEFSTVK